MLPLHALSTPWQCLAKSSWRLGWITCTSTQYFSMLDQEDGAPAPRALPHRQHLLFFIKDIPRLFAEPKLSCFCSLLLKQFTKTTTTKKAFFSILLFSTQKGTGS